MMAECGHIRDEFSALLDGELDAETRELVEEHLHDCSDCLRELDGLKRATDLYAGLERVSAPPEFEARLRAALRPKAQAGRSAWLHPRRLLPLAAAAGIALIAGVFATWETPTQRLQVSKSDEAAAEGAVYSESERPTRQKIAVPAEDRDRLEALGYLGGANEELDPDDPVFRLGAEKVAESNEVRRNQADVDGIDQEKGETLAGATAAAPAIESVSDEAADSVPLPNQTAAAEFAPPASPPPQSKELETHRNSAEPSPVLPAAKPHAEEDARITMTAGAPAAASAPSAATAAAAPEAAAIRTAAPRSREDVVPLAAPPPAPAAGRLAKSAPGPGTLFAANRNFHREGSRWVQEGYVNERVTVLEAGSRKAKRFFDERADLAPLAAVDAPIVFETGGEWYEHRPQPAAREGRP